ncbi:MAG: TPR repeat containing protein [Candidatus Methanohalarchaeum thermophilum]|uniref:non-specific serine/threonine protein kinase n=1 Tax=Methanohalarchaeum thermophilum TaxID=1903181 RepID=A0A1Q6DSQ6_METT1|nr:MAG: TPR repeat containing protein [Candidatus Methanohalarchaeum thermophilum]
MLTTWFFLSPRLNDLIFYEYKKEIVTDIYNSKKLGALMADYEIDTGRLEKLKQEVEKTIDLISEEHSGADLSKSKEKLREVKELIKKDEFDRAEKLIEESKLAAKPTTEYLLSNAKDLANEAETRFKEEKYEKCLEKWNSSMEVYERAKEHAKEREEKEVISEIEKTLNSIKENIRNAKTAKENQKMTKLVNNSNYTIQNGNSLFQEKKYDQALEEYRKAKNQFNRALDIADENNFDESKEKIKESLKTIEQSIENVHLSKTEEKISEAEKKYENQEVKKSRKLFENSLDYIKSTENEIRNEKLDKIKEKIENSLIDSKIGIARKKISKAEEYFKKEEFYKAKEKYKKARDYLENLSDQAVELGSSNQVNEINELIKATTRNITSSTNAMMDVEHVEADLININKISKAKADFNSSFEIDKPDRNNNDVIYKLNKIYEEISFIEEGGFADVYKAKDKKGREVALKVPRKLTEKGEEIFLKEIENWRKMQHRNIVKLIKPRVQPPHLVLEYIEGGSLREKIENEGSLKIKRAVEIGFEVGRGLEYAHRKQGYVHADINPKNILITEVGEPKITDFGFAKLASSESEVRGYTLQYAPPEQIKENKAQEKADVYQLGLTIYEMLTGKNPFDAGYVKETQERIENLQPAASSEYNPKAEPLDDLLKDCLSKKEEDRPRIREVREKLYKYMKDFYNKSLHLSNDSNQKINCACQHAFRMAKEKNAQECLNALQFMKKNLRDQELRREVKELIEELEFRSEEKWMSIDQLTGEIEKILKKIN